MVIAGQGTTIQNNKYPQILVLMEIISNVLNTPQEESYANPMKGKHEAIFVA
jgi:hypothetical protein